MNEKRTTVAARRSAAILKSLQPLMLFAATAICTATLSLSSAHAKAASASDVDIQPSSQKSVKGSLKAGAKVDLAWASNSSVACFPATQREHFSGNHVLYRVNLPKQSILSVKLKPKSSKLDLSLYAYSVGKGDRKTLPPAIPGVVSCEASAGSKSMSDRFNPVSRSKSNSTPQPTSTPRTLALRAPKGSPPATSNSNWISERRCLNRRVPSQAQPTSR